MGCLERGPGRACSCRGPLDPRRCSGMGLACWAWLPGGQGLHCSTLLTPELSVLMALKCRQSSVDWLVLLASAPSSERWLPGSVPASGSPFSLSNRARRCTSLRCFLVT